MTHTPGPWAAEPTVPSEGFDCWTIIDSSGQDLAWSRGYQNDVEMQGNARLIAAAPDLLAALKNLLGLRDETEATYEDAYESMFKRKGRSAWDAAFAAVTKVDGSPT